MIKSLSIVALVLTLTASRCSCNGENPLGSNFAIVQTDIKYTTLNYCTSDDNCDVGILMVPSFLIGCEYDDRWILAKNKRNDTINYYIIDKRFDMQRNNLENNVAKLIEKYVEGP